jgi:hypothetical protein
MKLVIRTVFFHIICIILFAFIYLYLSDHFDTNNINKYKNTTYTTYTTFTDFVLLSTTVQAGVGISDLLPISFLSKTALIIQQFIVILTHVITIYIFTI